MMANRWFSIPGFSMLWVVNSDGTGLRSVYTCAAPCHSLQDGAWSPNGSEIAFMVAETKDGATTSRSAILSLNVGSGAVRTIVEDTSGRVWLFHPRWSGDGQSIVFERDTFASNRVDESTTTKVEIAVASASGGTDAKDVASWDGPISGPGSPDPDWNSVDDLIVFCRNDNLFTVQPDGTSEVQLTRFDAEMLTRDSASLHSRRNWNPVHARRGALQCRRCPGRSARRSEGSEPRTSRR